MWFRQFRGCFQVIRCALEPKRLALAVRPNRFQAHRICSRRRDRLSLAVTKVQPEARRHVRFKHAQLDLAGRSNHEGATVRSVMMSLGMILMRMSMAMG